MQNNLETQGQEQSLVKPISSPKELTDAIQAYKDVQRALDKAMPDCIITIQGKKFRKKNYWRGVKTAFGLSVECLKEEKIIHEDGDWGYLATYRATAKNGDTADGDGACMASEKIVYQKEWINNKSKRILDENGNSIVDQLKTAENQTLHNVRGHAHTRSFNRAVSNLVGFGEVSAEEVNKADIGDRKPPIKQPEVKKSEPKPTGDVISEAQRGRLIAKSKTANISTDDMKVFLASYGFSSSQEVTRAKYEEICKKVDAKDVTPKEEKLFNKLTIPDECHDETTICKKYDDCPIKHLEGARQQCEGGTFK